MTEQNRGIVVPNEAEGHRTEVERYAAGEKRQANQDEDERARYSKETGVEGWRETETWEGMKADQGYSQDPRRVWKFSMSFRVLSGVHGSSIAARTGWAEGVTGNKMVALFSAFAITLMILGYRLRSLLSAQPVRAAINSRERQIGLEELIENFQTRRGSSEYPWSAFVHLPCLILPPALHPVSLEHSCPLILILVCLTLFAGSVALYLGSVAFGFVGDDDSTVLLGHPNLYAQDSLWAALREIFVGYFPREEPLLVRDLSWLFDARIFGFTDPRGYHLGNVLLNAVDVVLLFLLLLHATRSALLAAFTAALFATLAIHVEPVCWIMGRKDLLSAFFVLLALLAQSIQLRQSSGRWRWILAAIVFLLYPLAVLSKFSAIVLVLVLAAHRMLSPYLDGQRAPAQPFPVSEWPRSSG